jgi:Sec-independent protein translocase protein TatA
VQARVALGVKEFKKAMREDEDDNSKDDSKKLS